MPRIVSRPIAPIAEVTEATPRNTKPGDLLVYDGSRSDYPAGTIARVLRCADAHGNENYVTVQFDTRGEPRYYYWHRFTHGPAQRDLFDRGDTK